jgi:hypothetical protein
LVAITVIASSPPSRDQSTKLASTAKCPASSVIGLSVASGRSGERSRIRSRGIGLRSE